MGLNGQKVLFCVIFIIFSAIRKMTEKYGKITEY